MQDPPDAKKPCKGILKTSSSFDRPGASYRKSAKFDELNVLQTYHPADKDYGHMKIDEPKTPYYADPSEPIDQLDAELLTEKLRIAANTQAPSFGDEDESDEDFLETAEEKARRLEFERRRKKHYNEFEAVRLARKLIEEELDDEDDVEDEKDKTSTEASGEAEGHKSEELEAEVEAEASKELEGIESHSSGRGMEVDQNAELPPPVGRYECNLDSSTEFVARN